MTYFIGIDLAWSSKNPSGFAALYWDGKSATLVEEPITLKEDNEIVDRINSVAGRNSVIVAVDAPLVVPNETGYRICEADLAAKFGEYEAAAHSSNRSILRRYNNGTVRGEALVEQLAAIGIRHSAEIQPKQLARQVFEVYPHPAMVVLFKLDKTLKYKARPGRSPEYRREVFGKYRNHLLNLSNEMPPASLELPEIEQTLIGKRLKDFEDRLDAVFCAYVALYYWWWGKEKCHIFGTMEGGYIVTPY
jgi:predicted RNase H-like nuclease